MQRPGGLIAVVVLAGVVLVCAVNQIRVIRKTGWLPRYLAWSVRPTFSDVLKISV
jgi:hypothetical protein